MTVFRNFHCVFVWSDAWWIQIFDFRLARELTIIDYSKFYQLSILFVKWFDSEGHFDVCLIRSLFGSSHLLPAYLAAVLSRCVKRLVTTGSACDFGWTISCISLDLGYLEMFFVSLLFLDQKLTSYRWRQHTCVTNYVDLQTLKPDDDYVLPHQRLWTFDVGLVCPLSETESFLLQPLVCGTVFHRSSLLPPLSIFWCRPKSSLLTFLSRYMTFLSFVQCPCSDSSFWTL